MFVASFGGGIVATDAQSNSSIPEELNNVLNNASGNQPKITALDNASDGLWIALYEGAEPIYFLSNEGNMARCRTRM